MTIDCYTLHSEDIQEWPNGIGVCMRCAAKQEMAQSLKNFLTRIKMGLVMKDAA